MSQVPPRDFGSMWSSVRVSHHLSTKKAHVYNEEALKIQRDLWRTDPPMYGDELASSLMTKAQLLGIPGSHQREACTLVLEAQRIASSDLVKQACKMLNTRCSESASRKN